MSQLKTIKNKNVSSIRAMKGREKIAMLTAYDYPTALMLDEAGVDILLVGDSVNTVLYGEDTTLSITLEQMLMHSKMVSRGTQQAMVVGDMPFMSYQISIEKAVAAAGRFLKEAGVQAVKLEGGVEMAETVRAITRAGIPVMAHIGLTPQSIHAMGTYRSFGKSDSERQYLFESARELESAGAFSVVLECVESGLSESITMSLEIPTIGIGSGDSCDGQVLVVNDLLGLTIGHVPKFVRPEADLRTEVIGAAIRYVQRTKGQTQDLQPKKGEVENAPRG